MVWAKSVLFNPLSATDAEPGVRDIKALNAFQRTALARFSLTFTFVSFFYFCNLFQLPHSNFHSAVYSNRKYLLYACISGAYQFCNHTAPTENEEIFISNILLKLNHYL